MRVFRAERTEPRTGSPVSGARLRRSSVQFPAPLLRSPDTAPPRPRHDPAPLLHDTRQRYAAAVLGSGTHQQSPDQELRRRIALDPPASAATASTTATAQPTATDASHCPANRARSASTT